MKKWIPVLLIALLLGGCAEIQDPEQVQVIEAEDANQQETEKGSSVHEKTKKRQSNELRKTVLASITAEDTDHTHTYTATVVEASCEDQGYTEYVCACGDSYRDHYTPALGHDYTETVVESSADAQGYIRYTCTRCGDTYEEYDTES